MYVGRPGPSPCPRNVAGLRWPLARQLRVGWLADEYRERRYRAYVRQLSAFRDTDPFGFRPLAGLLFQTAAGSRGPADSLPNP